MASAADIETLVRKRDELKTQLAEVGDLRPGSLVPRFRKCGKACCRCAKKNDPGHGPSYSLTHAVAGKTVTRVIPAGAAVEQTRRDIEEYHRFRSLVQEFIAVSEQICDMQLRQPPSEKQDTKKNRARRPAGR